MLYYILCNISLTGGVLSPGGIVRGNMSGGNVRGGSVQGEMSVYRSKRGSQKIICRNFDDRYKLTLTSMIDPWHK